MTSSKSTEPLVSDSGQGTSCDVLRATSEGCEIHTRSVSISRDPQVGTSPWVQLTVRVPGCATGSSVSQAIRGLARVATRSGISVFFMVSPSGSEALRFLLGNQHAWKSIPGQLHNPLGEDRDFLAASPARAET